MALGYVKLDSSVVLRFMVDKRRRNWLTLGGFFILVLSLLINKVSNREGCFQNLTEYKHAPKCVAIGEFLASLAYVTLFLLELQNRLFWILRELHKTSFV